MSNQHKRLCLFYAPTFHCLPQHNTLHIAVTYHLVLPQFLIRTL